MSKRVGNAVARNRVKRLVREVFRTVRARIGEPVDFLIIAKPDARKLTYVEVAAELEAFVQVAPTHG